jgi:polar amino acid transport system permease protein
MFKIIVPQSYRRLIPPVGNEFIMLLKDSAMVSVIAITELLRTARLMTNATGDAFYYLPAAFVYLLLTSVFSRLFDSLEKKYSIYM